MTSQINFLHIKINRTLKLICTLALGATLISTTAFAQQGFDWNSIDWSKVDYSKVDWAAVFSDTYNKTPVKSPINTLPSDNPNETASPPVNPPIIDVEKEYQKAAKFIFDNFDVDKDELLSKEEIENSNPIVKSSLSGVNFDTYDLNGDDYLNYDRNYFLTKRIT